MESEALKISSAVFEKIGTGFDNGSFLQAVLYGIFTSLHFYRNNTKSKVIPTSIMKAVHAFFSTFMAIHGTQMLMDACDKIQQGSLFMVLKSEGKQIQFVTEPARDRKYAVIAYSRMLAEYANVIPAETTQNVVCGLIELATTFQSLGGFVKASQVASRSAEEMLMDGAIDQTFAFDRQEFIKLSTIHIMLEDKLDVPDPVVYMMQAFQSVCQQTGQAMASYLLEEKHGNHLQTLCNSTGIGL
jgi:hypothetical protein